MVYIDAKNSLAPLIAGEFWNKLTIESVMQLQNHKNLGSLASYLGLKYKMYKGGINKFVIAKGMLRLLYKKMLQGTYNIWQTGYANYNNLGSQ